MTAQEFKETRERLGQTQQGLAGVIGVTVRAVQYYEAGTRKIPGPVAALLKLLTLKVQNNG